MVIGEKLRVRVGAFAVQGSLFMVSVIFTIYISILQQKLSSSEFSGYFNIKQCYSFICSIQFLSSGIKDPSLEAFGVYHNGSTGRAENRERSINYKF